MITETLSPSATDSRHSMTRVFLKWGTLSALLIAALYLILALYAQRECVFAMLSVVLSVSGVAGLVSRRVYASSCISPAGGGMGVFVIFRLMYAVGIGFTKYSASNLLSF